MVRLNRRTELKLAIMMAAQESIFTSHLKRALVEVNDFIEQGDTIALSGNTGNSTEPHVHYLVWKNSGSIPVIFLNTIAHPEGLQEGRRYEAL